MSQQKSVIPAGRIEQAIMLIRGERVILDADLATLYGVPTKRLNEQVRRNMERFPSDFMFQLTTKEYESLRSQFATSNTGRGGRRYMPYVFTEHGTIMAANVLNSPQAVSVSVYVVRAFVKIRQMLSAHKALANKLDELERKFKKHDKTIVALIEAVRQLMEPPPEPKKKPIGYLSERD